MGYLSVTNGVLICYKWDTKKILSSHFEYYCHIDIELVTISWYNIHEVLKNVN